MKLIQTALLIAASAGVAQADTMTQTVNFSHGFDGEIIEFAMFDTLGGTRVLTGMTLEYTHDIAMDLHVESNGYTAVSAGDWFVDLSYISIHQFGLIENDPNPPFIGPGALGGSVTSDLGVSDGYNGTGEDTYYTTLTSTSVFSASYDGNTTFGVDMLETFTGNGILETYYNGFTEAFGGWNNDPNWVVDPNNPPDGPFAFFEDPYYGFFLTLDELRHNGSIVVTYEYTTVPAPAGVACIGLGGLMTLRRRR